MAKKKKRTTKRKSSSRKKVVEVPREPNYFVRQVAAILMLVIALFLLLGGFGTGGSLPTGMFDVVYTVLGIAAFLAPVALIYWGVNKLKNEDKELPFSMILSMAGVLIASSAWLHVAFVSRASSSAEWTGGYGGELGQIIGGTVLSALDKIPASILFFIFSILALSWSFGIPLQTYLKPFKRPERADADTDLDTLKAKAPHHEFKLNEGVPLEKSNGRASLKNSVPAALTIEESHEALTEKRDPNWQFPGTDLLIKKS
jgi:hypothetical protein